MDYKRMATGQVGLVCFLILEGGLQDRYVKDAEKYMDLGLYGKAIAVYEKAIKASPEDECIYKGTGD